MSFLSYAQNFEDVMLYRALKHVEHGTYVDIGAQHPLIDSVSKAFHERGWKGVHVEPVPEFAELVRKDRPGDVVLQVALAETEGTLELNVFPDTGLSTAVGAYADKHKAERGYDTRRIQVPMLKLATALKFLQGTDVHWLKIDVEGFEQQVLRGWDSAALRPWIMVVEATIPNSPETDFAAWDPVLVQAGYRFVYFDGLNRFYVAQEHPELMPAFASAPNVFDEVELSGLSSWGLYRKVADDGQQRANALEARLNEALARTEALAQALDVERGHKERTLAALAGERNARLQGEVDSLREQSRLHAHIAWMQREWDARIEESNRTAHQLEAVYASTSWKVTAPMRSMGSLPARVVRAGVGQTKRALRGVMRKALANPALKARALRVLAMAPGLERRVRGLALRTGLVVSPVVAASVAPMSATRAPGAAPEYLARGLSPRGAKILAEIHKVIEAKAN